MKFYVQQPIDATRLPRHIKSDTRIFSFFVCESCLPPAEYFDYIKKIPNPVTLLLNSYNKDVVIDSRCDVLCIDYFLYRTYREIVVLGKSKINPAWNADSNKFLFLTGKPDKPQRIGFLHALEQAGLAEHCVSSLFVNQFSRKKCQHILGVSDQEFNQFVAKFQGSPDNIVVLEKENIHYGGIPYNVDLFSTKFRVISETTCDQQPAWLTEKTWITVLNRQPFLIAGDKGSCKKLQDMGFRTFDQYLIRPYDHIISWQDRQKAIIENIHHWLTNKLDMIQDIEHNYQQFMLLAQQNEDRIKNYLKSVAIDANIHQVVYTFDGITGQ